MKILMVNKFLYPRGGAETYMLRIGEELTRRGHQVEYFGMYDEKNTVGNAEGLTTVNMDFHASGAEKLLYPFRIIYSGEARRKMRQVIDRFHPDIIHFNNINFQLTPSVILAGAEKNIPMVQTVHDLQMLCPNHMMMEFGTWKLCEECSGKKCKMACVRKKCIHGSRAKSLIGAIEGTIYTSSHVYDRVARYICPSRFIEEKLLTVPRYAGKTTMIHNFLSKTAEIDVQTYTKQDRLFRSMRHQKACYERFDGIYCVSENVQEAFSAKFGLTERVHVAYNMLDEQAIRRRKDEPVDDIPKGEFLMVSVGSLIPRKGFERLIHVCGLLKSRGYHFHLLILGKGELYEDLAEQVIDEHLLDSVQLLGFRDNPYPYMAAADLYVCPSYVEGFSTVVSEAVVLETPVVTTDCSGMREILGDSEYGLITQNTEESLFEGLRTMLDKPEVYQYYQQRVRERAPFFYMEERLKAYEEILDQ